MKYSEPYLKQKQNEDHLDSPTHFDIDDDLNELYKDIISSPVNIRDNSLKIPQESTMMKRPRSDYFKQNISSSQQFQINNDDFHKKQLKNKMQLMLIEEVNSQQELRNKSKSTIINYEQKKLSFNTETPGSNVFDESSCLRNLPAPTIQRRSLYNKKNKQDLDNQEEFSENFQVQEEDPQKIIPANGILSQSKSLFKQNLKPQKNKNFSSQPNSLTPPDNQDVQTKAISPQTNQNSILGLSQEKQIKYLGLVIEKDEEQQLSEGDIYLNRNKSITQLKKDSLIPLTYCGETATQDNTKRGYVPIREQYIKIVKHCRKTSLESLERRGRKEFFKTSKQLLKVAKQQKKISQNLLELSPGQ